MWLLSGNSCIICVFSHLLFLPNTFHMTGANFHKLLGSMIILAFLSLSIRKTLTLPVWMFLIHRDFGCCLQVEATKLERFPSERKPDFVTSIMSRVFRDAFRQPPRSRETAVEFGELDETHISIEWGNKHSMRVVPRNRSSLTDLDCFC